jgi:transposase
MSVEEAADLVGITKATGYVWLKRWNSKGYRGLIPEFGGSTPLQAYRRTEGKAKRNAKKFMDDERTSRAHQRKFRSYLFPMAGQKTSEIVWNEVRKALS